MISPPTLPRSLRLTIEQVLVGRSPALLGQWQVPSVSFHKYNLRISPPLHVCQVTDTITLSSQLVVTNQVLVTGSSAFTGFDGTLGLGRDMAGDICSTAVPTVLDNLFAQGKIESNAVGVLFNPVTSITPLANGELSFGGFDSSKIVGSMHFAPITSTSPANLFWGLDGSMRYGTTNLLPTTAGIIDTGTTLVLIPSNTFQQYLQLTGGVVDQITGLVKLTSAQAASLSSVFITIGNIAYEFTANAQLWPRILNTAIGGVPNATYSVIGDVGRFINHFISAF